MTAQTRSEYDPRTLAVWALRLALLGAAAGSAGAFFIWALDAVTRLFWSQGWLLYLLPASGAAVAILYAKLGGAADRGTNLILDRIHAPGGGVPKRMAPLVVLGTLATHLCGGSAGREGTAVQLGGSLAAALAQVLKVPQEQVPRLLMCGVAAGFGAVFGTPWAGALFAAEVLTAGKIPLRPLPYCLAAALLADYVCHQWGAQHSDFHLAASGAWREPRVWLAVALAGVCFGVLARGCVALLHGAGWLSRTCIAAPWLRPVVGGALVILLTVVLGSREYLGLGVSSAQADGLSIRGCFSGVPVPVYAFALKALFTAITVGFGFKGGEVTPLFFIGATAGAALGELLGVPREVLAACGFAAVFAAAANTPLACAVMGWELFGTEHAPFMVLACACAALSGGSSSLYSSQRRAEPHA